MIDRPDRPWTPAQVRFVAVCDLVAALVVAYAASGAGDEASLQDQVTWINLAVIGLLVAVVANGSLFLVARRAVGRRRLDLLPDVLAAIAPVRHATTGGWWWVPGTARAHAAGCQMIAGKPAEPVSTDRIRSAHLQRCELCG